ncbi:MAG: hypothetical protein ACKPHU_35630, partial [Planctomycetaceae bacterium]
VVGLALAGGLFVMMRRPREKLPLSSSGRTAKISVPVPEVSAAGFPGDLQIEAPPELDFAQLAALPGIGGRSARPASRPAAKPAAGAAAGAGGAAGANSGVPRPRPRPPEGGGGQAPGAGSKPRPAGEVRPGGESRPARPPRPPRPEGDSAGGASG